MCPPYGIVSKRLDEKTAWKSSPCIPSSAVPRILGRVAKGVAFLTLLFITLLRAMKDSHLAIPSPEYCPPEHPSCTRPDLFAFQVCSGIALTFCGLLGVWTWHWTRTVKTLIPSTPKGRLYGFLPESEILITANFTFQLWDFIASMFIEEHCTFIYMAHHLIAGLVTGSGLFTEYLHYYGVFFAGCTEFSSIFLVWLDMAKFFPPSPGSLLDMWVALCGPLFALSFFAYRVFMWWSISYRMWSDGMHAIRTGMAEKMRPGKTFVLYIALSSTIAMGLLQLYWSQIIIAEVAKVVSGGGQ